MTPPLMPIHAATYQQLVAAANPQTANQPETIPYWYYDTQTFTSAATISLSFFTVTNNDRSLSNWQQGGALADPNFFAIHHIMADIVSTTATQYVTSSAAVAGEINDHGLLLLTNRPRITLTLSDKDYGPWPFSLCHGTGGPTGILSSTVAAVSQQYANNGVFDGGLQIQGALLIPPKVSFAVRVDWPAAVTLSGDKRIRITMGGVLSRRVS